MRHWAHNLLFACFVSGFASITSPAWTAVPGPTFFAKAKPKPKPKPASKPKPKPPLEGKKPIAIGTIAGKRAAKVRTLIFEQLKESNAYEVADIEDLKPGAKKATIAKSAKAVGAKGVVMGRVSDKYDLTLLVYNGEGKLIDEVTFRGGTPEKLENAVRNEFALVAGEPIAKATGGRNIGEVKPPPTDEVIEEEEDEDDAGAEEDKKEEEETGEEEAEEEPKDSEKDEDEDEDDGGKKSEPSKPGRDPFEAHAGIRGYNRQFGYSGAVTKLSAYSLPFAPALLIGGRFYPAAFVRDDVLGNIGLTGQAELGIATTTEYPSPAPSGGTGEVITELETSTQEWNIGLIGRIPLEPVEIAVFAVYGEHTFILRGDENTSGLPPLVPDVKYKYIRPGVEVRGRPSDFLVGARVAPRFLTSYEQIDLEGVWFPGASGFGFDLGLLGGYSVLPFLDVVVGFDFLRYGFDFSDVKKDPPPTCATLAPEAPPCQKVASGASDTYISGWAGALIHLGGKSPKNK
jgi:hypothetical protein